MSIEPRTSVEQVEEGPELEPKLQAPGKTAHFFGDLPADETSAEQVLGCAALHQASSGGFMARDARPERLRDGILARRRARSCISSERLP